MKTSQLSHPSSHPTHLQQCFIEYRKQQRGMSQQQVSECRIIVNQIPHAATHHSTHRDTHQITSTTHQPHSRSHQPHSRHLSLDRQRQVVVGVLGGRAEQRVQPPQRSEE